MTPARLKTLLILLLVLLGLAFLYYQTPIALRESGWTRNVLRNWQEYGYSNLQGQLVRNFGGLHAVDAPNIYSGHRPVFLLPPFLISSVFGVLAKDGCLFQIILAILTWWGVYALFDRRAAAMVLASIFCLCPGYLRSTVTLDPLMLPAIIGIAVTILIARQMEFGKSRWVTGIIVLFAVGLYSPLNWTTGFTLGILVGYLFAVAPSRWPRLIPLVIAVVVISAAVTLIALSHKVGYSELTLAEKFAKLNDAYLIGAAGYDGNGMSWGKALRRLIVTNLVAWLPLMVVFAVSALRVRKPGELVIPSWRALIPLAIAIASVTVLRNYNAHHPWQTTAIIGTGLLFSIGLVDPELRGLGGSRWCWGFAVSAFFYCNAIFLVLRVNGQEGDNLFRMIAAHTQRKDVIVVEKNWFPKAVENLDMFSEEMDRQLVSDDEYARTPMSFRSRKVFFLSPALHQDRGALVAQSRIEESFIQKQVKTALDFYRTNISRRAEGDQLFFRSEYFLYQWRTDLPEKNGR